MWIFNITTIYSVIFHLSFYFSSSLTLSPLHKLLAFKFFIVPKFSTCFAIFSDQKCAQLHMYYTYIRNTVNLWVCMCAFVPERNLSYNMLWRLKADYYLPSLSLSLFVLMCCMYVLTAVYMYEFKCVAQCVNGLLLLTDFHRRHCCPSLSCQKQLANKYFEFCLLSHCCSHSNNMWDSFFFLYIHTPHSVLCL